MITRIFSKSKSINFIVVFFITLLAFVLANIKLIEEPITTTFILKRMTLLFMCYATILVLNFIVSKNNLTKENNYEILLFSLFFLAISQTTTNVNILFSNFFILLGLRRIISLRSQINVKKKLFDAAFWIAIASLFYFWAILFFVIILIALLLYSENNIKHWLIPYAGLITVFLIGISISIVKYNSFFDVFKSLPRVGYNFDNYNTAQFLVAITILLSYGTWSSIFYIKNIKYKKKGLRASFYIVLIALMLGFLIVILDPKKGGSEFLFMFGPLAIIIANYAEVIKDKWFKEVFILILVLTPFIILLL